MDGNGHGKIDLNDPALQKQMDAFADALGKARGLDPDGQDITVPRGQQGGVIHSLLQVPEEKEAQRGLIGILSQLKTMMVPKEDAPDVIGMFEEDYQAGMDYETDLAYCLLRYYGSENFLGKTFDALTHTTITNNGDHNKRQPFWRGKADDRPKLETP